MIKSIRLINWRSHADSKLEFRKGTNLLVGIMGAGKSSILEGISFALFGTFPALERRKLKLDHVVRLNEASAKIFLEFDWDRSSYRVERVIERSKKGTSSHAEVYCNNSLVEHGSESVNSYLENLTGVDYDLFTRAIYSEQNNIDHFLNLDPKRRKEEIDRLLGLDKFEIARSNIVAVINRIRSKRETLSERFKKEKVAELEEKEKICSESGSLAAARLNAVVTLRQTLSVELTSLSEHLAEMKKSKERFELLLKDDMRFSAQLESLIRELSGKKADESVLVTLKNKLITILNDRSKLLLSLKLLDDKLAQISKELGSIELQIKLMSDAKNKFSTTEIELKQLIYGSSLDQFVGKQKDLEQTLLSNESEYKSIEREICDISEAMACLKPGLSECPFCSSSLTDSGIIHIKTEKDALIKHKRERLSSLSLLLPSIRKENELISAKIRKILLVSERLTLLEQELKSASDLSPKKAELDLASVSLSEEKKTLQTRVEVLTNEAEKLRYELSELEKFIVKKNEADKLTEKLKNLKTELSSIKFNDKIFEETREKVEKLRLEIEKLNSENRALETQIKLSTDLLSSIRAELSTLRLLDHDIKELYLLEEQLSIYRNALLETQTSLRSNLTEAITGAMNEIWSIFYPYKNYHGLRLFVSEKDYLFEVNDGGNWRGLETIASGGERASAALALRVALAMVLTPKLSWLILDEPTHNLDTDAVELLSSALQFKVPEVVRQTFVITHDEAFMGSDFASS
ncbi:SMC family ATPase, partial [Candidatus Micrarchaeota archaeon]|nr:SMC family ATPase [Candidatus Micrarchaeota archaeon]